MKVRRGLGCVFPRCYSCSNAAHGRSLPLLWQISTPTQTISTRRFSTAVVGSTQPRSHAPVRISSPPRSGGFRRAAAGKCTGTTAFSTSSSPRSAEGENPRPAAAGEVREGTRATAATGGKAAFPERLIVYHAGTGKTTFLACLKVTTLFVFGFFDMIMTPAYLQAGEPLLKTAGVALCGIIPAVYVAWSTSPFVAAIHVHLPSYARWSRSILERFARTAPPNTRVDITTMSLIGKPRVSSMTLGDLHPARRRLGTVNYVRDPVPRRRVWWHFPPVREFNVQEDTPGQKKLKTGWVWNALAEGIVKKGGSVADGAGKSQGKAK